MTKNKYITMLLALLASVCLWLYVVTVVDPSDEVTISGIPVVLKNMEQMQENGMMLNSDDNPTVTLKVSGRRSELKKLTRGNIVVTADLGAIDEEGEHELTYSVAWPEDVSVGSLTLEERSPQRVTVSVEHYLRKEVPIRVVFEGEADEQEDGDSIAIDTVALTIEPEEVAVTGPASRVNAIDYALVTVNRTEITQTTTKDYSFVLIDLEGNTMEHDDLVLDAETVQLKIPVLKYKEVPLVLETVPGGGATDENVTYSLSTEVITICGDPTIVDEINEITVGTLNYASITVSTAQVYPITLPTGVINVTGIAEVTATIRVNGLQVITMTVDNIKLINIPQGMTATALSESIQLTLRGITADLMELEAEDIAVIVDLANYTQAGTYIIPVTVSVPNSLQVGAVGSNTLTITLE